jgi:hypothetical protein
MQIRFMLLSLSIFSTIHLTPYGLPDVPSNGRQNCACHYSVSPRSLSTMMAATLRRRSVTNDTVFAMLGEPNEALSAECNLGARASESDK